MSLLHASLFSIVISYLVLCCVRYKSGLEIDLEIGFKIKISIKIVKKKKKSKDKYFIGI